MSKKEGEGSQISRREIETHIAAGVVGWMLTSIFDPFRRLLNAGMSMTPLGRQPDLVFANSLSVSSEDKAYQVQILNAGQETAEDVAINVGFNEKISEATDIEARNIPPSPDIDIEMHSGGTAQLNIDHVRREFDGEQIPLFVHFTVDEDSQSSAAHRIEQENGLWVAYSYSWTFLGERFFETDKYVIGNQSARQESNV